MGNVVRIGDSISCGDHAGGGSSNVFINGMPVTTQSTAQTTGHGCYPPTVFVGEWSKTVFANGSSIAIKNKTRILPHRCGKNWHDGVATTGSNDVSVEA